MKKSLLLGAGLLSLGAIQARAIDYANGQMKAVPVGGKAPVIDGDLRDFNLSAAEPMFVSAATSRALNAEWTLMYDERNLYIGVRASLPNRPLQNPSSPQDAFWNGDIMQLRLAADPTLSYPLDANRDKESERVAHISLWKNTETGQDFLHINRGTQLDKGQDFNPPGSAIKVVTDGSRGYTIEARLPWNALRAPNGVNPFAPGQKAALLLEALWVGGDQARTTAVYRSAPGNFGFQQPQTWGQVEFAAQAPAKRTHPTVQVLVAGFEAKSKHADIGGVPFTVNVPEDGLKVSVNILGARGEVLREIIGGEPHPKGPLTLRWDGKDQWGHALTPGSYKWGAYFHGGLKAQFMGAVGYSGKLAWQENGAWGGDHSNPIDTAADAGGLYFLWPVAEAGRPLVKTDYAGNVLWRKNPFVGGGFGPFYAVASNGRHVFLARGEGKPQLSRLDTATGQLLLWNKGPSETPISATEAIKVPAQSSPLSSSESFTGQPAGQPECVGLAAGEREVFASVYSQHLIQVLDAETGAPTRTLSCPGPRGLALDARGNLFAVSFVDGQAPCIVRFDGARGMGRVAVSKDLGAPWDVAVDKSGRIYVSDGAHSQQIKVFAPDGNLAARRGTAGGRAWAGRDNPNAFLNPAGVAIDARGGLLIAESSIPKIVSRWNAADGKLIQRWFGAPIYWNGTWPDPDDPMMLYFQLNGGFARARIPAPGGKGLPEAYWNLPATGLPDAGNFETTIPTLMRAKNGRRYLVGDVSPNGIALVEGDKILPVGHLLVVNAGSGGALGGARNTSGRNFIEVWSDANGDHRKQPGEVQRLESVGGEPLPAVADWFVHTSQMMPNGDFLVETSANKILKIPAAGFNPNGSIRWNLKAASFAVPSVLPAMGSSTYTGPRGQSGLRVDARGNIYTAFSQTAPALSPELESQLRAKFPGVPRVHWGAFATPELARSQMEGMGHTSESNVAKFAKYDSRGRMLWIAGRKATAGAKHGEMYHFWSLAGLIESPRGSYIAGASEWGPITIYTGDGFFVDTLMNDPAQNPPPSPYTFGGETMTGRVQFFPRRGEVWAYAIGQAYKINGFQNGVVAGERRTSGTLKLDKIYERAATQATAIAPLQIVPVVSDPLADAATWQNVPAGTLTREGEPLAEAKLGYDVRNLYARIHVSDSTPGQNSADTLVTAFKGGDTAGVVLGPSGPRPEPGAGDVRIMAALIGGKPTLIAMKATTRGEKKPETYSTPAGGTALFEFVGEVPGGRVLVAPDADGKGYTATFSVPRSFLEFDLAPASTLSGDIEVRLSGQGQRGLQTTERRYLFTPRTSQATMVDDVPTEARIYTQGFGKVEVK